MDLCLFRTLPIMLVCYPQRQCALVQGGLCAVATQNWHDMCISCRPRDHRTFAPGGHQPGQRQPCESCPKKGCWLFFETGGRRVVLATRRIAQMWTILIEYHWELVMGGRRNQGVNLASKKLSSLKSWKHKICMVLLLKWTVKDFLCFGYSSKCLQPFVFCFFLISLSLCCFFSHPTCTTQSSLLTVVPIGSSQYSTLNS